MSDSKIVPGHVGYSPDYRSGPALPKHVGALQRPIPLVRNPATLRAQVLEFHRANEQPIIDKPAVPADERVRLRLSLIAEEFVELLRASVPDGTPDVGIRDVEDAIEDIIERARVQVDPVEFTDALADLDYVVEGTRIEFGIDGAPIAAEVHRSNMSKLGADGKPVRRPDGKILKGPNFTPPDIAGELRKQGWEA